MEAAIEAGLRRLTRWLGLGVMGASMTGGGLAWDASKHAHDATLAAREGVFSLSNPAHLLIGAGMAVAAAGLGGAVIKTLRLMPSMQRRARWLGAGAAAILALSGIGAVWAVGQNDDHGHTSAAEGAADAGPPGHQGHNAAGQGPAHEGQHSVVADVASATPAQRAAARSFLDALIAGTSRYRDVSAAEAGGFKINLAAPGRFPHAVNPQNRSTGPLDPALPQALVYARPAAPGGNLILIGALFIRPLGTAPPDPAGPIMQWHFHETCVYPGGAKAGKPVQGACPEGTSLHQGQQMMHVWFTAGIDTAFAERPPIAAMLSYQRALLGPTAGFAPAPPPVPGAL